MSYKTILVHIDPGRHSEKRLEYIAGELGTAGLDLYRGTGLQEFSLVTSLELGPGNHFSYADNELTTGEDFIPLSFSSSGALAADLVFAGYGFWIEQEEMQWDDYSGMNVDGKWVMILRGVPGKQEASSPYMNYSEDRAKALHAADQGCGHLVHQIHVTIQILG